MTIEIHRIVKDNKLDSILYVKDKSLIKYNGVELKLLDVSNDLETLVAIKNYCFENNAKSLKSILIEKENIEDFFKEVNRKRKMTLK